MRWCRRAPRRMASPVGAYARFVTLLSRMERREAIVLHAHSPACREEADVMRPCEARTAPHAICRHSVTGRYGCGEGVAADDADILALP